METQQSRYDAVADWYVEFTRGWSDRPIGLCPEALAGQRVLDAACGYGVASRHLAKRGAGVTGVDLSTELLGTAAEIEARELLGIDYVHGDVTGTDWWDGVAFDGVLCNMALMDIDDLDGALWTFSAVLRPGGWFSFSVFHPCYPGGSSGSSSGLPSWPSGGGYDTEGWWTTEGDGIRGRVGANHRMLSTYLNAVLGAGFEFEEFGERSMTVPVYFTARCRRRTQEHPQA